jgi:hypothetical protein
MLTDRFRDADAGTFLEVLGPATDTRTPQKWHSYDKLVDVRQAGYLDFSGLARAMSNVDHLMCAWIPQGQLTTALLEGYVMRATVTDASGMPIDPDGNPDDRYGRVGFNFVSQMSPMPFHAASQAGMSEGKRVKLVGATVRVYQTVGFTFAGQLTGPFDTCEMRAQGDPMDIAVQLKSGDYWVEPQAGYKGGKGDTELPRLYVRQDRPLPLQVLAIFAKLEVGAS